MLDRLFEVLVYGTLTACVVLLVGSWIDAGTCESRGGKVVHTPTKVLIKGMLMNGGVYTCEFEAKEAK